MISFEGDIISITRALLSFPIQSPPSLQNRLLRASLSGVSHTLVASIMAQMPGMEARDSSGLSCSTRNVIYVRWHRWPDAPLSTEFLELKGDKAGLSHDHMQIEVDLTVLIEC